MLDHLDDLASDFSAIHGIKDIGELDGPVFFRLAWRITSYQGVMRDEARSRAYAEADGGAPRQQVGGSAAELRAAPEFAGIFSTATSGS